jgi:hypothetical protein
MRVLRDIWRRHRRDRPAATGSLLAAVACAALAAGIAVAGLPLLAQFVAGLALVPLSVTAALYLIPARPWAGGGDDWRRGGGGDGDGPGPRPAPSGGLAVEVDWERFERDFGAYAEADRLTPA